MRHPVSDDPPLPVGYYEDPARRCTFSLEKASSDFKGLAFAIILRAVEDGCNKEWLQELADFYEIPVPKGLFDAKPNTRMKTNNRLGDFNFMPIETTVAVRRPLLEWEDGLMASRGAIAHK